MFDIKKTHVEGRQALGLPTRGRLDTNQNRALNAYAKRAYLNHLVALSVISAAVGNVVYGASFPTNDENYVERSEGLDKEGITPQAYHAAGGRTMENLVNAEFHDGIREWAADPVAVAARPADGTQTRGRKPGTPNRDKATIEAEKAAKAIRVEARKALGLPTRGRLTAEQAVNLEKYIAQNSNAQNVMTNSQSAN